MFYVKCYTYNLLMIPQLKPTLKLLVISFKSIPNTIAHFQKNITHSSLTIHSVAYVKTMIFKHKSTNY